VTTHHLNVGELVEAGANKLELGEGSGRENPRREASLLLESAAGLERDQILKAPDHVLDLDETLCFWEMVEQRARGVPLQLLVGGTGFHDVELKVAPGVFIPRPETELLVDLAKEIVEERLDGGPGGGRRTVTVLDLCTGTGAIAVALSASLQSRPGVRVHAGDWNPAAVRLARQNARRNGVEGLVDVRRSNLFSAFADLEGRVDVLVSNPPYVSIGESEKLPVEVRLGDPHDALFDPEGGTGFHRRIARRGRDFLRPGGVLLLEIGATQGEEVRAILCGLGYDRVRVLEDLAGRDRFVCGERGEGE
jgi:release factor glutamine methyltransferase